MKIEDVDPLFTALSEEFRVPKPNYCIFQVSAFKKLDPLLSSPGWEVTSKGGGSWASLPMDGKFYPYDNYVFITLLFRRKGQIRREAVVHEFFHYLHWIQGKFKVIKKVKIKSYNEFFWKLLNDRPTEDKIKDVMIHGAEIYDEERRTKRETRKWLREHPLTRKGDER